MASDKNFFEQLNTKTLGDNAASTVQALANPVHLQSSNKEVLDAIIQVNRAGMRDGLPIPKTAEVATTGTQTENLTRIALKTPAVGEVWAVSCLSGTVSGVVMNFQFMVEDLINGTIAYITDYNVSSAVGPINEAGFVSPIHIDENCRLSVNATRVSGTYGSYTCEALLIRVR